MKKVAIIGAGISGLFIANLLKKNSNYKFTIYEKNESINSNVGYGIQLSVNSIKLLNKIGFDKLQDNEKFNPYKIDFYSNNNYEKLCDLDLSEFNLKDSKYTTLKRSVLINFLKRDLGNFIKTDYRISKIDYQNQQIKLKFENNEVNECDILIISDGVFSKSKNLISNGQFQPKYNNLLAIRGTFSKDLMGDKKNNKVSIFKSVNDKNISIFLSSNFHSVIYPVNPNGNLNYIGIMGYKLSSKEQKDYALFESDYFKQKIFNQFPIMHEITSNLRDFKIFPVFVNDDFCSIKDKNIHLIGDAFFAFPPSFAQGASQSIEGAYELYESIEKNEEMYFSAKRSKRVRMVNNRSKFNQFAFHLSNPITVIVRNFILKRLVKNKKFLSHYLGKIYEN